MPAESLPEYAFLGRSNVGKSSLINMMLGQKQLAKTSATPGKTLGLNCFDVDNSWIITDMPGYGWAKVSLSVRRRTKQENRNYLLKRPNLSCLFLLIDSRLSLQALDRSFLSWLGEHAIPFAIVFTKVDKLNRKKREAQTNYFQKEIAERWASSPTVFFTSTRYGEGRKALLDFIGAANEKYYGVR